MKVKELMERVGMTQTGRAIAYIKDGLDEMNMMSETHVTTQRIDITKDQRFYDLPNDAIKILDVRCKNQNNTFFNFFYIFNFNYWIYFKCRIFIKFYIIKSSKRAGYLIL